MPTEEPSPLEGEAVAEAIAGATASSPAPAEVDDGSGGDPDPIRQWQQVRGELEVVEGALLDLREELRQLEQRREALAAREIVLRKQAGNLGEGAATQFARVAPKDGISINMSMSTPREVVFDPLTLKTPDGQSMLEAPIMTPRLPTMLCKAKLADSENKAEVYDMEEEVSPKNSEKDVGQADTDCQIVSATQYFEDWEHGLECSVAKCGVCGMKFPLDVGAIEQHSLECEGPARKEGRRPTRSDFVVADDKLSTAAAGQPGGEGETSGPDRGVGRRVSAAAAGAAGLAGVVAGAGSLIQSIAAKAKEAKDGGGAGGGLGAVLQSKLAPGAAAPPPTAPPTSGKAAVGDRAALLRSRMQKQRSRTPQPGAAPAAAGRNGTPLTRLAGGRF